MLINSIILHLLHDYASFSCPLQEEAMNLLMKPGKDDNSQAAVAKRSAKISFHLYSMCCFFLKFCSASFYSTQPFVYRNME